MATDYSKKTNPELVEILKSRSLPHTGKKADMVARLQEDDASKAQSSAAPAAKTDNAEDVIDWEDDEVPAASTTAAKPATDATAPAEAPAPAATGAEESKAQPDITAAATEETKAEVDAPAGQETSGEATTAPVEEKPAVDYSMGLPITELEEELKKRKARAEKFGITEDSKAAIAEAEKKLERAKRFGAGVEEKAEAGVGKLDQALPSEKERSRKRGRGEEQATRGGKRRDFGGRNQGRNNRGGRGGNRNNTGRQGQQQQQRSNNSNGNSNGNAGSGMSEKDRLALEARKKRFGNA